MIGRPADQRIVHTEGVLRLALRERRLDSDVNCGTVSGSDCQCAVGIGRGFVCATRRQRGTRAAAATHKTANDTKTNCFMRAFLCTTASPWGGMMDEDVRAG